MQAALFNAVGGHDGLPPRVEPRPRDAATVGLNHATNAARAGGRFDAHIAEFLRQWVNNAETFAGVGAWSRPFRFERDPDALTTDDDRSCAAFVFRRAVNAEGRPVWPAADTCRRRGTALADRLGYELANENGRGLYRVRRALVL